MIPVKYNVRSLRVRWLSTLMTVVALAFIVWITVLTFGMIDGLNHALRVGGDEADLIVMRKGSNDETSSNIDQETARKIANLPGIAKGADGAPLCAAEFMTILTKPRRHNGGTVNLIVRGIEPASRALRPNFKIVQGRDFKPGVNEAITSEAMAKRFENLAIGERIDVNQSPFTIVGYYEAGGSSAESEVWMDRRDLNSARREPGAVSVVNLRTANDEAKKKIVKQLRDDKQFLLNPVEEPAFFESQMSASIAISIVGWVIFFFLLVGAMFAIANTMFASVAIRGREIGALRAIGFSRFSVVLAFVFESVLICLLGGIIGCVMTLPFNGISTGTANWVTFSEVTFSFRFGPAVLLRGIFMATMMGFFGGLFPAIRAAFRPITAALRMT
jgi:putative ABC transport system permease protein